MTTILERFNNLTEHVREKEIELHGYNVQVKTALEQVESFKQSILNLEVDEKNHLYAIEELKRISTQRTENAKNELEDVLNWVLDKIPLEQQYSARIEESTGKNRGLNIILSDKDTGFERSISEQSGTALAQILSFLMVIIVIKFSGATRIVVIDEVFSGIDDPDVVDMFGKILVALSENENFQFIMVEHQPSLDEIEGMNVVALELTDYEKGTVVKEQYTKQKQTVAEGEVSQNDSSESLTDNLDLELDL